MARANETMASVQLLRLIIGLACIILLPSRRIDAIPLPRSEENPIDFANFIGTNEKVAFDRAFTRWVEKSSTLLAKLSKSLLANDAEFKNLLQHLDTAYKACASNVLDDETKKLFGDMELDLSQMALMSGELKMYLELDIETIKSMDEPKKVEFCNHKSISSNLESMVELFTFNKDGKLFNTLRDKLADILDLCLPIWDDQFQLTLNTKLDKQVQRLLLELVDNLRSELDSVDKNAKQWPPNSGSSKLIRRKLFEILHKPPSATSILHFILRYYEQQFALDDNFKNPRLPVKTFVTAVNALVVPLCNQVLDGLTDTSDFYLKHIYRDQLIRDDKIVNKLLTSDQGPTEWIVGVSICRHLMSGKEAERIFKNVHALITKGRSQSIKIDAKQLQSNSDVKLDPHKTKDLSVDELFKDDFEALRHKNFMKTNGYAQ